MKIAGLDVGSKTIGLAVSDALGMIAHGITTLYWTEHDFTSADKELKEIFAEHNVEKVVIGLPKNMNNTEGERAQISKSFAKHIEKVFSLPTVLNDERLTTMAAERTLLEADVSRKKRKKVIDKMAATLILQNYLDQL